MISVCVLQPNSRVSIGCEVMRRVAELAICFCALIFNSAATRAQLSQLHRTGMQARVLKAIFQTIRFDREIYPYLFCIEFSAVYEWAPINLPGCNHDLFIEK